MRNGNDLDFGQDLSAGFQGVDLGLFVESLDCVPCGLQPQFAELVIPAHVDEVLGVFFQGVADDFRLTGFAEGTDDFCVNLQERCPLFLISQSELFQPDNLQFGDAPALGCQLFLELCFFFIRVGQ